jgi:hypothetical protein
MPGCCPSQTLPGLGNVHPLYPQALESTGLKSRAGRSAAAGERSDATASARAISAWQAAAEQRRRTEWLAIELPHNSSRLFARLPFSDAVRLAALVGTGQMTWAELSAALDAKIKLAIGQDDRSPHEAWEAARRTAEDEIWARYHAKCDAVFAHDTAEAVANPWSREELRDRERILNRLRNERDRALEALRTPRSSGAAPSERVRAQLTAAERDALGKLNASGFAGSRLMADAIRDLAAPFANSA